MAKHPCCSKTPPARLQSADGKAPETLQRSSSSPRPAGGWTSPTGPAARFAPAAAVAAAVFTLLVGLQIAAPPAEPPDAGVELALAEPETEEPGFLTDGSTQWGAREMASLTIPPKPMAGQKTVCDPKRREVSINGGCYKEQAGRPPCAEGEYKHDKKCWSPVAKASSPATTLQE